MTDSPTCTAVVIEGVFTGNVRRLVPMLCGLPLVRSNGEQGEPCQRPANGRYNRGYGLCGHTRDRHYAEDSANPACDGCANDGRGGNDDLYLGPWVCPVHPLHQQKVA